MYTETYSLKLHTNYRSAEHSNRAEDNSYCCATSSGVTRRSLDLSSQYVFCENTGTGGGNRPEYRLQAYLVKKAKANNWVLPIPGKDWVLIDAERNFANAKSPRKPDLIAYSQQDNSYIILELKIARNFQIAKDELSAYHGLLSKELEGANAVYGKNVPARNIKCYLVWPGLALKSCTPAEYLTQINGMKVQLGVVQFWNFKALTMENATEYFNKNSLEIAVGVDYGIK